jgi:hypothetical protein
VIKALLEVFRPRLGVRLRESAFMRLAIQRHHVPMLNLQR